MCCPSLPDRLGHHRARSLVAAAPVGFQQMMGTLEVADWVELVRRAWARVSGGPVARFRGLTTRSVRKGFKNGARPSGWRGIVYIPENQIKFPSIVTTSAQ